MPVIQTILNWIDKFLSCASCLKKDIGEIETMGREFGVYVPNNVTDIKYRNGFMQKCEKL